jgi:hypothetical protein
MIDCTTRKFVDVHKDSIVIAEAGTVFEKLNWWPRSAGRCSMKGNHASYGP